LWGKNILGWVFLMEVCGRISAELFDAGDGSTECEIVVWSVKWVG